MRRIDILGVGVHDCDDQCAARTIDAFLREEPPHLHQVCTVNPEFVMEARRNPAFRRLLNSADLATPDGAGIIAAGKLLRRPFAGRATGVALVERLAAMSAQDEWSLFFLGSAPGVADEAARVLAHRHPGVRVVGTFPGSPRPEDWPEIKRLLDASRPDVLLVAYGAPRQDLWIAEHRGEMPDSIRLAMGVGGVFDYLSGRVKLAPAPIRRVGMEWLYRLVTQPWRWRRILRVFAFGALALRSAVVSQLHR